MNIVNDIMFYEDTTNDQTVDYTMNLDGSNRKFA